MWVVDQVGQRFVWKNSPPKFVIHDNFGGAGRVRLTIQVQQPPKRHKKMPKIRTNKRSKTIPTMEEMATGLPITDDIKNMLDIARASWIEEEEARRIARRNVNVGDVFKQGYWDFMEGRDYYQVISFKGMSGIIPSNDSLNLGKMYVLT